MYFNVCRIHNAGTGGRHDHRASYDALGNMLMDISYNGAVGTGAGGINGSVDISSNR